MMETALLVPLVVVVASVLTALGLYFLLRPSFAQRLAMDEPNHRSLHTVPTPRVGGLMLVPVFLLIWLVLPGISNALLITAGLLAALALLSYLDDRADLSALVRLSGHVTAAAAFTLLVLDVSEMWGALAIVLWIGWCTNLFNFMDGADGLAGGMAVFGFAALGTAALLAGEIAPATACYAIVGASLGFLWFNFSPARVFLGDAGSVPLGFLVGAMGLLGWRDGWWPVWFPLLVFSPFIVDATVTLFKRAARGERVWQAHRDHYYQRLVRMGWSHRRLAVSQYLLMAMCGASGLLLMRASVPLQYLGLAVWISLYAAAMIAVDICWKRHQTRTP